MTAVHTFSDEYGEHTHAVRSFGDGGAYDPKTPITCEACIDALWAKRYALCDKYGWTDWPAVCSSVIIPERKRP